ncbi:hypothetical protein [Burkholderia multivorans]|nr:hypothetical protein [Burkholderia multivorans]
MQFLFDGTTRELSEALINLRYRVAMHSDKKEGRWFCIDIYVE